MKKEVNAMDIFTEVEQEKAAEKQLLEDYGIQIEVLEFHEDLVNEWWKVKDHIELDTTS